MPPAMERQNSFHMERGNDLGRRDLEGEPLLLNVTHYDPNNRWHRLRRNLLEAPKGTASIFADIPYTHTDWKRHRNAAWRHRLQLMLFLRVAGGFWWQLFYVAFVSVLVGLWHDFILRSKTSSFSKLEKPFNMTSFALSLLLVFRTNSSYARWWEARQIWGAVVNLSRNYARQALVWLPPDKARVAVRWMMAAPFLLKCHLRVNADARENVSHILLPQEVDWLEVWAHRPNAAAHIMSTVTVESRLDTNRELVLIELVNAYIDCVGKCERIFKTPIPPAYTRHTSRYLMLYVTFAPLVLWSSMGWWTPFAAMMVTFLLLGTENIGVQIEEPFRVLPLDDMCRGIENALREMERQHNSVAPNINSWLVDPEGLSKATSSTSSGGVSPTQGREHIPPGPVLQAAASKLRLSLQRSGLHLPAELHLPVLPRLPSLLALRRSNDSKDVSMSGHQGSRHMMFDHNGSNHPNTTHSGQQQQAHGQHPHGHSLLAHRSSQASSQGSGANIGSLYHTHAYHGYSHGTPLPTVSSSGSSEGDRDVEDGREGTGTGSGTRRRAAQGATPIDKAGAAATRTSSGNGGGAATGSDGGRQAAKSKLSSAGTGGASQSTLLSPFASHHAQQRSQATPDAAASPLLGPRSGSGSGGGGCSGLVEYSHGSGPVTGGARPGAARAGGASGAGSGAADGAAQQSPPPASSAGGNPGQVDSNGPSGGAEASNRDGTEGSGNDTIRGDAGV